VMRPLHPSLRGLYAGADTVNRLMAFLREPKERLQRLTESLHMLPLFSQECVIADITSALGLEAVLSKKLAGTGTSNQLEPGIRHASEIRDTGRGVVNPFPIPSPRRRLQTTQSTGQEPNVARHDSFIPEKPVVSSGLATWNGSAESGREAAADGAHAVAVPERRGKIEPISGVNTKQPQFLREELWAQVRPPAISESAPVCGGDKNDGMKGRAIPETAHPVVIPDERDGSRRADSPTGASHAFSARSLRTPVVTRDRGSTGLENPGGMASRVAKASSLSPATWSARLESSLGKLESMNQSTPGSAPFAQASKQTHGEHEPGEVLSFGRRSGLRGLASLGEQWSEKRAQLERVPPQIADPASHPSSSGEQDDGLEDRMATVLRNEALRSGVSPEEWDQ